MDEESTKRIWKSYVWHDDKCFFVSTLERTYDTCEGSSRGNETLVWEYDWSKKSTGRLVYQGGGVADHQRVCRCVIAEGAMPDEDNPRHARFFSD
jgi:hypothetical protein